MKTRAAAEVFRESADHETRIAPGVAEQPGEHGRGGGFAVGAGDDEVAFAAQEELLHDLGQGMIEELAVERGLGLRVAARDGVADDDHVGVRRDVFLGGSPRRW